METTTTSPVLNHADRARRRAAIADSVKTGSTYAQVARAFGVSIRTVQAACQEFEVVPVPASSAA